MFNRTVKAAFAALFIAITALCGSQLALADPLDNVFTRITDSNGKVVSGGKVYVFTCGTTTPVTTYSVSSSAGVLSSAQAHPVVADSGGKVAAIFVPAGCYKYRITNSAGTTLYEVDNYIVKDVDLLNVNNLPVTAKTSAYTIADADDGAVIAADATSGTLTLTAESQDRGNGFPFCVVKTDASANPVTVTPDAGETVNGAASYSIATQYQSACFVSRGAAGWFVWAERDPIETDVKIQVFTASGTYTPATGMDYAVVYCTGSGGGGGGADTDGAGFILGAAAGGGAGGTAIERYTAATIGASQTVTIGTAGAAGSTTGGNGGTGGDTTFGALMTATGGAGGAGSGTSAVDAQDTRGGAGGVPTGGDINITGGNGDDGVGLGINDNNANNMFAIGGGGGASFWGGGGESNTEAQSSDTADLTSAGNAGVAYGSGGSGAVDLTSTTGVAGGAGKAGICVVYEFL